MTLLVIGVGSIGLRHIRNLRRIGVTDVTAYDPEPARMTAAGAAGAQPCATLAEALARRPRGVLVCTPPTLHLEHAQAALTVGADIFVEKPLAAQPDGVEALLDRADRAGRTVTVGYNLRFHPAVRRLKSIVEDRSIGRLLALRAEFGQYLPDWRPGQDYRKGYITDAETGGIVLDSSHELDYIRWLGGEVSAVAAMAGTVSDLDMAAEDVAMILLRLTSGALAEVHLDCVQRAYRRGCTMIGTEGTVVWAYQSGLRRYEAKSRAWVDEPLVVDINETYVAEMTHWLACLRGEATPLVDGREGWRVLQVALAARTAARSRREVGV